MYTGIITHSNDSNSLKFLFIQELSYTLKIVIFYYALFVQGLSYIPKIVIVGPSHAGKSTVASKLAKKYNLINS